MISIEEVYLFVGDTSLISINNNFSMIKIVLYIFLLIIKNLFDID
jgi:hypothetical protein